MTDLADLGHDSSSQHDRHVDGLHFETVLNYWHMGQDDLKEDVSALLRFRLLSAVVETRDGCLDTTADVVPSLHLRVDLRCVSFVQARGQGLDYKVLEADGLNNLLVGRDTERLERNGDRYVLVETVVFQVVFSRLLPNIRLGRGDRS